MTATCLSNSVGSRHTFQIVHEGFTYDVVIWTDEKGKFMDDEISWEGNELDNEGAEGTVREAIIDYLDKNWDTLVK